MNARIRAYVGVNMAMNSALAFATIFRVDTFKAPSYSNISGIIPLPAWGAIFTALAVVGLYTQVANKIQVARLMFVVSAAALATWAVGFLTAYMQGKALGPTGFIVWGALAAYNVILVSTPGITKLEHYIDTHAVLEKHLAEKRSLDK